MLAPTVFALAWSIEPAAKTLWAVSHIQTPQLAEEDWQDEARLLSLKRSLQKQLLKYSVYVPLEDIIASSSAPEEDSALVMQKACGQGKLFVWLPLKFKLPITGVKVYEWCWKPATKDA